jgi:fructose 1,6-bisphosphate aldolase/phosphatase
MRGSHNGPLMPVPINSGTSFFDGPPVVSALGFCVSDKGTLTEPVDCFAEPFWNHVRDNIAAKAMDIRRQGFSGPAMLHMEELEYGGIVERLKRLEPRFRERRAPARAKTGEEALVS